MAFLDELRMRGQDFVAEVPVTCTGWITKPRVTTRRRKRGGQPTRKPRLVQAAAPFRTVRELAEQAPALRDQPWQAWHVKDGAKGPMVWEAQHVWFFPRGVDDLPQDGAHLIVARNVLEPATLKFFVGHAPRDTGLGVLLKVAFSRWHVERCFEDEKMELGFDHFEGRSYVGLMRHQTITAVTHLFLARTCHQWRGEKIGVDGVPSAHRGRRPGAIVVADGPGTNPLAPAGRRHDHRNPASQRRLPQKPPQNHPPPPPPNRNHSPKPAQMPVG